MILFLSVILSVCGLSLIPGIDNRSKSLKGDYFGQKPPGTTAALFAPGILSTHLHDDGGPIFTPDGKEVFWRIYGLPHSILLTMKKANGKWSRPRMAPFSGQYMDGFITISPDGKRLFFNSPRPLKGNGEPKDDDLWFVDKTETGWTEARNIGKPISSEQHEGYGCLTKNNRFYFIRIKAYSGKPEDYVFMVSDYKNGRFTEPMKMGPPFNSGLLEYGHLVSPDERFIVYVIKNRKDGFGRDDLYVSFRKQDKSWSEPVNLGPKVNSTSGDCFPSLSPDGKYLFFVSWRRPRSSYSKDKRTYREWMEIYNGPQNAWGADLFWVSTEIFEPLKRKIFVK